MKLITAIKHLFGRPCGDVECETPACMDAHRWARLARNGVRTCPSCETCVQPNELHCPVCDTDIALAASNDPWLRGR